MNHAANHGQSHDRHLHHSRHRRNRLRRRQLTPQLDRRCRRHHNRRHCSRQALHAFSLHSFHVVFELLQLLFDAFAFGEAFLRRNHLNTRHHRDRRHRILQNRRHILPWAKSPPIVLTKIYLLNVNFTMNNHLTLLIINNDVNSVDQNPDESDTRNHAKNR